MRYLVLPVVCLSLASPLSAEEEPGLSLIERGAQLFLEGLLQEMEPAIDDLRDFADDVGPSLESLLSEMGPALKDLIEKVEDWSLYHPPEILENGDIIIRRKAESEKELDEGAIDI